MNADAVMKAWAKLLNCRIEDLGEGAFFFSRFKTAEALEEAWSLVPEHKAIRERLAELDKTSATPEELGGIPMYHLPSSAKNAELDTLPSLIENYLRALIPIAEETGDSDLLEVLRDKPKVCVGNLANAPAESQLDQAFYRIHSESLLNHLPDAAPYSILYTYAVYLTKDDRVAAFILWPCLQNNERLENAYRLGFELWRKRAFLWSDEKAETILVAPRT